MDYQKELDQYKDTLSDDERRELSKLASHQKDIAVGESAEDFIRHPFFNKFQNEMNRMIDEINADIVKILQKKDATIADAQAQLAGIEKIKELKRWLNKHVIAGRVAKQAISIYEEETDQLNAKVQSAVDQAKLKK